MIIIYGSKETFNRISKDFYTVWRGLIQDFNGFKQNEEDFKPAIEAVDILRSDVQAKYNESSDKTLRERCASATQLFNVIEAGITKLDKTKYSITATEFKARKKSIQDNIKLVRAMVQLIGESLKKLELKDAA